MAESYSLWIKPSGKVAEKLSQEIASQAAEYSAPVFEPHVTLLGDIQGNAEEIMQQSRELAGLIKVGGSAVMIIVMASCCLSLGLTLPTAAVVLLQSTYPSEVTPAQQQHSRSCPAWC